ncbi:MAG: hypothetical protein PHR60_02230 [Eubacteriales bacterium]|nr:hypothetical protein [Eubacteriales bacterium]
MSTKTKYLLIALFFFIITLFSAGSMIQKGFNGSSFIYTLIFAGVCILFVKNALRP